MTEQLHVLIAGAGIGGLALAHGLRRAGIRVSVFEQDGSIDSRGQGYRINLRPVGDQALAACLPPAVHDRVRATAYAFGRPKIAGFDSQLSELFSRELSGEQLSVDRSVLRRVLLDEVHFGHTVAGVDEAAGRLVCPG
ncbi:MAG TPA: NAD(P)-binding protein [Pseudonocardiaceae bacterium]|jgi:2-polyprenyl-6-methoxyphenol hydroxylase-like FAD-dependent oxidoreductase|nr:NAD(P)-binding protein [Pseudonocardiaceae bacterium]